MNNHPCARALFEGCNGQCRPCQVPIINLDERPTAFNLSASLTTMAVSALIALALIGAGAVAVQGRENWRQTQIQNSEV